MKEEEILDAPSIPPRSKKDIWVARILLVLACSIIFLIPRVVYIYLGYDLPNPYFPLLPIFFSIIVLTIGIYFFVKNINYNFDNIYLLIIQCFIIIFSGVILNFIMHNLLRFVLPSHFLIHWFPIDFSIKNITEALFMSSLLSLSLPIGVYHLIKNKNRWLLLLILILLFFLIFFIVLQ